MTLSLDQARKIVAAAFAAGEKHGFKPLTIAITDPAGDLIALERADGSAPMRAKIAYGKANACAQLRQGGRMIFARAQSQAFFIQSLNAIAQGDFVPVPGGVLVKDASGAVLGAAAVTGDTPDNDEIAMVAAVEAAGLTADAGA